MEIGLRLFVIGLSMECVWSSLPIDEAARHLDVSTVKQMKKIGKWKPSRKEEGTFVDICALNAQERDILCRTLFSHHVDMTYDYSRWRMPMMYVIAITKNRQFVTGAVQCLMDPPIFVYGHISDENPEESRLTVVVREGVLSFPTSPRSTNDLKSPTNPSARNFVIQKKPTTISRRRMRSSSASKATTVSRFSV